MPVSLWNKTWLRVQVRAGFSTFEQHVRVCHILTKPGHCLAGVIWYHHRFSNGSSILFELRFSEFLFVYIDVFWLRPWEMVSCFMVNSIFVNCMTEVFYLPCAFKLMNGRQKCLLVDRTIFLPTEVTFFLLRNLFANLADRSVFSLFSFCSLGGGAQWCTRYRGKTCTTHLWQAFFQVSATFLSRSWNIFKTCRLDCKCCNILHQFAGKTPEVTVKKFRKLDWPSLTPWPRLFCVVHKKRQS